MPGTCWAKTRSPASPSRCFSCLCCVAALGPALVPYSPLASDTAQALTGPSPAHWFGTDQLGRDIFSRVVVATRLDLGMRDRRRGARLRDRHPARADRRLLRWLGRSDRRPRRRHDHGVPALRAGDGHRRRTRQQCRQHRLCDRDHQSADLCPARPAPRPMSGAMPVLSRQRGCAAMARRGSCLTQLLPNILPLMMVQVSLTLGYAILNAAGLSFIGLGVRPPTAGMGHHGRRGRQQSSSRASGGWRCSRGSC